MGSRVRIPTEQVEVRALISSMLDYLLLRHGAIVEIIVKDWISEKDRRLQGLRQEQINKEES